MRRIRVLKAAAWREARMAMMFSATGCVAGVFAAAVGFGEGSGGALWLMLAAAVIPLVWVHAGEFFKLLNLIEVEKFYESKRDENKNV